ncbi:MULTISPECIES: ComEC/Rec2 family competence protein [Chelativorans]|jgi:competence protein ComEC|uniref:ComEC/Rec2-related protein n=1 Tax=Chelativorans sp. (strain BNC1) TaxID=266779 RepID=Q11HT6_CHESB|nr:MULTISPECIES: ComEC/Rec2 family competence protein [Chelativorans]
MRGEPTAEAESERFYERAAGRDIPAASAIALDAHQDDGGREIDWARGPTIVSFRGFLNSLSAHISSELAREHSRGAAFLCLPVLMAAGVVTYFALPEEPAFPLLLLLSLLLIIVCWLSRTRPGLLICSGAALAFMLGAGAAKIETWRVQTAVLGSEVTTRVIGQVVSVEHQANGRARLILDVLGTERPQLRYAPERVRLTAREAPPELQPGDIVEGLARLMPPSGPVRPGSYDFSFVSYFTGTGALGFFMTGPERIEADRQVSTLAKIAHSIEGVRLALAERIRTHVGGAEGEVIVALITGYRPGIPEEVNEWLRRSGLAHILSISGLHMALVAATVMFILRAGAALFPGFSSRFPVKKYAATAALLFCTLYLFLSGTAVAAQRSYIMLAVMLAALIFDRAALTMRNVAIAALIIIILSPHEVVGPSFQMSFAATAALVAGYAVWSEWRRHRRTGHKGDYPLAYRAGRIAIGFTIGMAATSLIAGTASALFGVWHFQRVTPLALPANLAAAPFVSIIAMPAAVVAILAMPFGLDGIFFKAMGEAITAVIVIAKWFSDRSPVDAVGMIPLSAFFALTAALVILVVSTTRLRLIAVPLCVLGFALLVTRQLPDVLISEDARLVGVRGEHGILAVNRPRPNAFTTDDWMRALDTGTTLKPVSAADWVSGLAFSCADGLCMARHVSGALVAHAETESAAETVCLSASLIVIDDAAAQNPCGPSEAVVLTKRDLARSGSASIHFDREGMALRPEITFAIGEPWRPWHAHRAWSRASRGLRSNLKTTQLAPAKR